MFKRSTDFGGAYMLLSTPFSLLGLSAISDILFTVFIILAMLLFFNVKLKFIDNIKNEHETWSYYLCSFGWVPYFMAVVFLILVSTYILLGYEQRLFAIGLLTLGLFAEAAFIVSPIVAFLKKKFKKMK